MVKMKEKEFATKESGIEKAEERARAARVKQYSLEQELSAVNLLNSFSILFTNQRMSVEFVPMNL